MRPYTLCATICLALLLGVFSTAAGQTFKNEDTAVNRKDYTWGTRRQDDSGGNVGTADSEKWGPDGPNQDDSAWGHSVGPKEPERDWYDEVIITVSPDVGYGSKTTTSTDTNSSGEVTGSTTTTTTY